VSETTEIRVDTPPSLNDAQPDRIEIPQGDPHAAARERIAIRAHEKMLAQIAEQQGGEPAERPEVSDEDRGERRDRGTVPSFSPSAHEERIAAEEAAREAAEAPVDEPQPAAPQQPAAAAPQLFPLQLPDGRISYVTGEQLGQLAHVGAAALSQPRAWAPPQQQQQPPPQQVAAPPVDPYRELARRIHYGDEETTARALAEYSQLQSNAATQQAMQHWQTNQNLQTIGAEFPDVFSNRVLAQVAAVQLHEIRQADPMARYRSDLDNYRLACNNVRAAFMAGVPQQAAQRQQPAYAPQQQPMAQPASAPSRIERKRNATAASVVGTDRRLATPDAGPAPLTNREIINDMRRARGQAPL
jgi:hypothetical protein